MREDELFEHLTEAQLEQWMAWSHSQSVRKQHWLQLYQRGGLEKLSLPLAPIPRRH